MASKAAESAKICPVCFETRPLKIAGGCKHSVCTECLTIAMGSHDSDVFTCPTCQADCPRPWDGVEGLVDSTGQEVAVEDLGPLVEEEDSETVPGNALERGNETRGRNDDTVVDVRCKICRHQKKEVQAVNLCADCNNLHICQDCTEVHARNKATEGHVVIPFRSKWKEEEAMCETHDDSPINRYCRECKQTVCVVCVMLEHGDHTMETLGEVVETKASALKVILTEKKEKMAKMLKLESELTLLTRIAPKIDKQDILIKDIEDHAEKCIDEIVKWKEDLKGQVRADYKIISDIPEYLEKVSKVVLNLQGPIERAEKLLSRTEHQPVYLDNLVTLQHNFEALAELGGGVEEGDFTDQLQELHNCNCRFTPEAINSCGKIDENCVDKEEFEPTEMFKFTVSGDSNDKFIPCVANLGQKFAVAHLTRHGEPSSAFSIYEYPGELKHTFSDRVPPLYDMSATPDEKVAVLSDGTGGTSRCVKLFDAETGYISSTRDVDIAKPLSLGVTLRHQYVILGDNEEVERQITVVDKDGRVEHTHVVKEEIKEKRINPSRITCGGRFIFVIGKLGGFAYEIKDQGIYSVKCFSSFIDPTTSQVVDISANMWDDILYSYIYHKSLCLSKRVKKKGNWALVERVELLKGHTEIDIETRVSAMDSHIVLSHGDTIRVYNM